MSLTMYGIRNCSTVKKARDWLEAQGVAYDFHDYRLSGIAPSKLAQWSKRVGWEALLNRAGMTFRKLGEADKTGLTEDKALALMSAQPSLIKRPLLEIGGRIVLGFKPELYAGEVGDGGAAFGKKSAETRSARSAKAKPAGAGSAAAGLSQTKPVKAKAVKASPVKARPATAKAVKAKAVKGKAAKGKAVKGKAAKGKAKPARSRTTKTRAGR